ncbi:hypothetical protein [uncultured Friedmanniella sp.]|uniref:hypothetical protein n=1 Tax=uncultured Friedmanniella sp. TaxID=335381 RepID=UPI0035C98807
MTRPITPLRQTSASSATSASSTQSPTQIRSAIRPTRRLPAAIWAEPGSTSVIPRNVSPRRSLTRSLRC